MEAIGEHHDWLTSSGELQRRRTTRARHEVEAIALGVVRDRLSDKADLDRLAALVAAGELDPYTAADQLLT